MDRTEDVTEIKVYSNEQSVTLFVDGVERETAEGSKVFKFEVPITETHKIRAVSGACEDEITVKKVENQIRIIYSTNREMLSTGLTGMILRQTIIQSRIRSESLHRMRWQTRSYSV